MIYLGSVLLSKGLSDLIRAQIRDLDAVCSAAEPLCMKLNWDMLETRDSNEVNDLLWYEDGRLVGYLGLYGMGPEEIELTGMVHPDFRRRGIFGRLFREAVEISRSRRVERLLLISERQSDSGAGFARSAGLKYDFSEYRMLCSAYRPAPEVSGFSLRPAATDDIPFLMRLDEACFGRIFPGGYDRELEHLSVAVADGRDIGKIGIIYEDGKGYVFGVAILPDVQGRGYGRAMLDAVLKKHFQERETPVILEVAVKNDGALTLYKARGFLEVTIYDYYEMKLRCAE